VLFRNANLTETGTFVQSEIAWHHVASNGAMFEVSGGYQHGAFTPSGALPEGSAIDRAFDGPMPPLPSDEAVNRLDLHLAATMAQRGRHVIRVGGDLGRTTSSAELLPGAPIAELVDGEAARVWIPSFSNANSERHLLDLSAYLADRFVMGERLSADLGLRFEHLSGSANGAPQSVSWPGVMPRLSVRWTPPVVNLFVAYGQYQRQLTLPVLAFGDPGAPTFDVYRWNDVNGNGRYDPADLTVLVARSGAGLGLGSIDPSLHAPRMHEFSFGADRIFKQRLHLSFVGTIRREHTLIQPINIGVPASSYIVRSIPDVDSTIAGRQLLVYDRSPSTFGLDRYELSNIAGDDATYDGLEIRARYETPQWWTWLGASAYKTEGSGGNRGFHADENDPGVIGELFSNPNAATNSLGRLYPDRSYVLKWSTGFNMPHRVNASVIARYADGQAFSRMLVVPGLNQGTELVRAEVPGLTRFTFTTTVDARIEKQFMFGPRSLALHVDVYNLTNLANEVEENPVSGASFRASTAIQPPLAVRIGARFAF
jgi:hypothetical protein